MDVRRVAVVKVVSDYRCGDGSGEEERALRERDGRYGHRE